jgi:hypothetical protein
VSEYVITADMVRGPVTLLDLAIPRSIEPKAALHPDVTLVSLDDLADRNHATDADIEGVMRIIAEEATDYRAKRRAEVVAPTVTALRDKAATVVDKELARLTTRVPDLDEHERDVVARTVRRVVTKILHAPTVRVQELAAAPGGERYATILAELIDLAPDALKPAAYADEVDSPHFSNRSRPGDVLAAVREAAEPADTANEPDAEKDTGTATIDATGTVDGAVEPAEPAAEDGRSAAVRTGEMVLAALTVGGGVAALSASHEAVAAHHGNNYLPLCEQYYKSHRAVLFTLVDAIELEATSAERSVLDALEFVKANRDLDRRAEWIEESVTVKRDGKDVVLTVDVDAFAGLLWRRRLRDRRRPGRLARRHLEVCVFSHLAAELRSGDIAVVGSDSYANLHAQLMSWEECEDKVAEFCTQAGIPTDAKALAAHYRALLTKTATEVDAGYPANTDLRLEGGRPVLARRKGAERRPAAIALEAAVLDRLPDRALLAILARTAHLTGWPRHFGPASGSDPKIRDTLGRYVVTAFAYGGNLGPTEVARHMRGVSAHEIYTAGNKHATPDKIYKASADVVNAFAKLDVAAMWGDGSTAATDGSQIDTWGGSLRDIAKRLVITTGARKGQHPSPATVMRMLREHDERTAAALAT